MGCTTCCYCCCDSPVSRLSSTTARHAAASHYSRSSLCNKSMSWIKTVSVHMNLRPVHVGNGKAGGGGAPGTWRPHKRIFFLVNYSLFPVNWHTFCVPGPKGQVQVKSKSSNGTEKSARWHVLAMSERLGEGHYMRESVIVVAVRPHVRAPAEL